jgi:hypothetical protein
MQSIIGDYLGETRLGKTQVHKNLAVFPILRERDAEARYVTLDTALSDHNIVISERSEAGAVPLLFLKNDSDIRVLIFDGEELVGAKQNRIVNTSVLVAPHSELEIPVSCVERGRWDYDSKHFSSERRMMYARLRAAKADQVLESVRSEGTFSSNQDAIWHDIDIRSAVFSTVSETAAMRDVYTQQRQALEEYATAYTVDPNQVGALFAVDGKVAGMECFGRRNTLREIFPKLVQSYALDAAETAHSKRKKRASGAAAKRFLAAAAQAQIEARSSVGEGVDIRIEADGITGLGLAAGTELLHLSVFARVSARQQAPRLFDDLDPFAY